MSTNSSAVAQAQHSEPSFALYGRVAANGAGNVSWPDPPDLHFSLVITDAYSGITVIDGQPTLMETGFRNLGLIKTNSYTNSLPDKVVVRIPLMPPEGMSRQEFARKLIERSRNFSSYVAPYSLPQNVRGSRMRPGQYNSSSYLAGLLKSVIGHVPLISTPQYQTPGWETPMPEHFFKGEAIR
ncbi:hypothetical protein ABL841_16545 [Variovorax paradoxus]|jgi:hypothetical protein|uniref:hypothetical protein n=1 Tax=Variovorax paradoxus TaxID=34073 RepID=UPI0012BBFB6C|nr:hypothetical protein [Variovorax paradoxus]